MGWEMFEMALGLSIDNSQFGMGQYNCANEESVSEWVSEWMSA